jgi:hypothetical protein
MVPDTTKLLEDALKLPPEAHAALAGDILESLDNSGTRPIRWAEARRRITCC